jgi:hypothetical protein
VEEQARRTKFIDKDHILHEFSVDDSYPMQYLGDGRFQKEYEVITFKPNGMGGEGFHRPTGEPYKLIRWPDPYEMEREASDYVGSYDGSALAFSFSFHSKAGRIWLRRKGMRDAALQPAKDDVFTQAGRLWTFHRGPDGNIDHVLLSTSRIIDLKFNRSPPPP